MAKLSGLLLLALTLLLSSAPMLAQTSAVTPAEPIMRLLDDLPTRNQIPLLDNRFRIDDGVQSITMVFFRRPGSSSVVLVRPDGSKVYYNTADKHDMRWYDAATYDVIEITNPMPGPWQAIGRIMPESKILVLTDVELSVEPLPEPMMVGETFKLTAQLLEEGKPVNAREFKDILNLQVVFTSTNNKDYENYALGVVEVATFRDDGRGYDMSARDGVFTGELNLVFGAGEWIPRYIVKTPLYTREIEHAPVIIQPAPVAIAVKTAALAEGKHLVTFNAVSELIDVNSLLFQGEVRYPDGETQPFSLIEPAEQTELIVENRGAGSYIMNVSVFGQMTDGREFVLNLPEERFLVTLQALEAPALAEPLEVTPSPEVAAEEEETPASFPWFWVILINVLIFGLGAVGIWLVSTGRGFSVLLFWRKKKHPVDKTAADTKQTGSTTGSTAKSTKESDNDGILDLSLLDD